MFTNTVPVDAYRGAGRPESNYLVERLVDAAARELGIDRVELRRRNMVPSSAMPHATPVGKTYDSGDFRDGAGCGAEADGLRRLRRARAPRPRGAASGAASASPIIWKRPGRSRPSARKSASPTMASSMSMSARNPPARATRPPTSSLPSQRLGIDGEKIRIRQGDTDTIPVGGGTGGARSLYSEGQAILLTADR